MIALCAFFEWPVCVLRVCWSVYFCVIFNNKRFWTAKSPICQRLYNKYTLYEYCQQVIFAHYKPESEPPASLRLVTEAVNLLSNASQL